MERREAHALGMKTYDTGRPCKNGHRALRYVTTGSCVKCLDKYRRTYANEAILVSSGALISKTYTRTPDVIAQIDAFVALICPVEATPKPTEVAHGAIDPYAMWEATYGTIIADQMVQMGMLKEGQPWPKHLIK